MSNFDNSPLLTCIDELKRAKRKQQHAAEVLRQIEDLKAHLPEISKKMIADYRDIESLKGKNINAWFTEFIGNLEAKLNIEESEYIRSSESYDQAIKKLFLLKFELNTLQTYPDEIALLEQQMNALLNEAENALLSKGGEISTKLSEIRNQITKAEIEKELCLAQIESGEDAIRMIFHAAKEIIVAKDHWKSKRVGVGQMVLSSIRNAVQSKAQADIALCNFKEQIQELFIKIPFSLTIHFPDFEADNSIINDEIFNDHGFTYNIDQAIDNLTLVKENVEAMVHVLKEKLDELLRTINQLHEERKAILIR